MDDHCDEAVSEARWLTWVKQLRSIAQAGLTYAESPFDRERYEQILAVAAEIAAVHITEAVQETAPVHVTAAAVDDTPAAAETNETFEAIHALFAGAQGYETPKVDVRGVIFQDDRILLVRELLDGGRWTLPGGWADVNDRPGEAVEREVWEESGYRVRATKLLAVYDRRLHGHRPPSLYGIYKLFFLCDIIGGQPATSIETAGAAFFAEDEIPELSLGRVTRPEITRLFEHHRHPEWTADFD